MSAQDLYDPTPHPDDTDVEALAKVLCRIRGRGYVRWRDWLPAAEKLLEFLKEARA